MMGILMAAIGSGCGSASEVVTDSSAADGVASGTAEGAASGTAEGAARGGHEVANHGGHEIAGHGGHHGGHVGFADADEWSNVFDDPARDAWQQPDEVLRAMELEPSMTVADVGSGTGYFAVRLARAVPEGEVIGTDIEPDMVRFLNERAAEESLPNLRSIAATHSASGLEVGSVDRVLVVNVWHHLGARVAYAEHLASTLRAGGKLVIVEFSAEATHGPPARMRLAPEAVIAELEAAGFSAAVSPVTLPDQYIVVAQVAQ